MTSAPRPPLGATARVRVPATSANLGSAFDAAGLALTLYDDVDVEVIDDGCVIEVTGEGAASVPRDESHLVIRAVRAGLTAADVDQPGLALTTHNRIPHGRGLGSSAAATVAGLLVARVLARAAGQPHALPDTEVLALAARFEGHGDNVGATLRGGLTLVWTEDGDVASHRLDVHPDIRARVLVPTETLSTARARGLIPESVPHRAAAHNVARAALLVCALTREPALLLAATDDRLHQPYRAGAFPASMDLLARLRSAGLAAVISGAGPSVLVLGDERTLASVVAPSGWHLLSLRVDSVGATQ